MDARKMELSAKEDTARHDCESDLTETALAAQSSSEATVAPSSSSWLSPAEESGEEREAERSRATERRADKQIWAEFAAHLRQTLGLKPVTVEQLVRLSQRTLLQQQPHQRRRRVGTIGLLALLRGKGKRGEGKEEEEQEEEEEVAERVEGLIRPCVDAAFADPRKASRACNVLRSLEYLFGFLRNRKKKLLRRMSVSSSALSGVLDRLREVKVGVQKQKNRQTLRNSALVQDLQLPRVQLQTARDGFDDAVNKQFAVGSNYSSRKACQTQCRDNMMCLLAASNVTRGGDTVHLTVEEVLQAITSPAGDKRVLKVHRHKTYEATGQPRELFLFPEDYQRLLAYLRRVRLSLCPELQADVGPVFTTDSGRELSTSNFTRSFRRIFGTTPTMLRKFVSRESRILAPTERQQTADLLHHSFATHERHYAGMARTVERELAFERINSRFFAGSSSSAGGAVAVAVADPEPEVAGGSCSKTINSDSNSGSSSSDVVASRKRPAVRLCVSSSSSDKD